MYDGLCCLLSLLGQPILNNNYQHFNGNVMFFLFSFTLLVMTEM